MGVSHEKFRRPSISFTEGLRKAAAGTYREKGEYTQWMFRALVIAVDSRGGQLETPDGLPEAYTDENGNSVQSKLPVEVIDTSTILSSISTRLRPLAKYEIAPTKGPRNPPNSIKARILSGDKDKFIPDDALRIFWPLFPASPDTPSAGEMVYVVFEDEDLQHGLWLGRVASNSKEEGVNQILKSKMLIEGRKTNGTLYPDLPSYSAPAAGKPFISKSNRLTMLFIDPKK